MNVKAKKKKITVKIELDEREAVALSAILGNISGWNKSEDNPRAVIGDKLYQALDELGLGSDHKKYDKFADLFERGAMIRD